MPKMIEITPVSLEADLCQTRLQIRVGFDIASTSIP